MREAENEFIYPETVPVAAVSTYILTGAKGQNRFCDRFCPLLLGMMGIVDIFFTDELQSTHFPFEASVVMATIPTITIDPHINMSTEL